MSKPPDATAPQPWDSLGGVVAKLLRAERHLESLSVEVQSFVTSTPVSHVREAGPTGEVWVRLTLEPAPIGISVTIEDVLHQLRSAVDHLAYGLVMAAGGTPTKQTSFPILEKPPKPNKPIKVWSPSGAAPWRLYSRCSPTRLEPVPPRIRYGR